jgi:hypothetical protein
LACGVSIHHRGTVYDDLVHSRKQLAVVAFNVPMDANALTSSPIPCSSREVATGQKNPGCHQLPVSPAAQAMQL